MPEGYTGWAQKADHLTAEEFVRVARAAVGMGFRKFRLTGGEPTIRPDLVAIASGISALDGVEVLGVSTNGTRLKLLARELRDAGVTSINISLDALDPALYRKITGSDIEPALAGLEAALEVGFDRIKLNCVLMRGVNEEQIFPLVDFAAERGIPVRFIELMPLSNSDVLSEENFLPVTEVIDRLAAREGLEPMEAPGLGCGPARYHRTASGAVVGFIGAITTSDFCDGCNKIRLTADGKIRPCLGRHNEIDLLESLRSGATVESLLVEAIARKPEDHEFRACYEPDRPMTAIGG